jgi:hypothetical protein
MLLWSPDQGLKDPFYAVFWPWFGSVEFIFDLPTGQIATFSTGCCVLTRRSFAMGFISIAKPYAITVFVGSGTTLESRVALGPAGEPAFGPPGRPTAGFRRLRWRAHLYQKRRNYPVDPHGRKATGIVAALPRQPHVRNTSARQSQLGEGGYHQPRPPIRLLGVAHPRRRPSHALLEESEGVLQIEAPDVSARADRGPAPSPPGRATTATKRAVRVASRRGAGARPPPG